MPPISVVTPKHARRVCVAIGTSILAVMMSGCAGGARVLEDLGSAFAIIAVVALVVFALVLTLLIVSVTKMTSSMAEARVPTLPEEPVESEIASPGAHAALRSWWWALVMNLTYAGMVWLVSRGRYGQGELAHLLVLAGPLPLVGLLIASMMAFRRGRRWPAAVSLTPCLAWGMLMVETWPMRPLSELPGRVVQLSTGGGLTCARLSNGRVACLGMGVRGDGSQRGVDAPTLVRGLDDATELRVGDDIACALRREGPPICWGAGDDLPVPDQGLVPWELPGAEDAVELVPSRDQIVWRTADGRLGGWPDAPPVGRDRAQRLVGDGTYFSGWFCAVEADSSIVCWSSSDPDQPVRIDAPTPEAISVDGESKQLCVASFDALRCYDLPGPTPPRELDLEWVQQLIDLDGASCALDAGGRVTCWRASRAPREVLDGIDRIFGAGGIVCGETGERRRCERLDQTADYYAQRLLGHDQKR